jgi:hypothetical protein
VQEYGWRMRVESTFQDAKSRGWDLEASLIADRERFDRLLLALFVAMWWVIQSCGLLRSSRAARSL